MANSILGAGIFGLPALLAKQLDGYSPLSCVIAGCGALIIAAVIAEIASRFETTGGLYLYGREALGRFPGLLIAWLLLLTRIAAPAAAADLFANYLGQFIPALHGKLAEICLIAVLIGHLALLNYIGVKTGKTVSDIFTTVKVGLLALFIVAGLAIPFFHSELHVPLHFGPTTANGWFEALLLLVFGYGGFEGALMVGGESRNPRRDMPFALLTALQEYNGTVVFVSHDRYFIDNLATRVFEIQEGHVHVYPGNYEDYLWRKAGGPEAMVAEVAVVEEPVVAPAVKRDRPRVNPMKAQKMRERLSEVESEVASLESAIQLCEAALGDFKSADETARLSKQLDVHRGELEQRVAEWEELTAGLDEQK